MNMSEEGLFFDRVVKSFGGTQELKGVSLKVGRGEIVALLGENGAGHEDVGRALFGACRHQGAIRLEGASPDLANPQAAMRSGIGLVARDRLGETVAPGLAIRENLFLNPSAMGRGLWSWRRARDEEQATRAMGRRVALQPNIPTLAIEAISGGNQQKVVVGRWLDSARRLLICEDPTAGVDVGAKAEIYHLVYQALASGMGVLVVSTEALIRAASAGEAA